MIKLAFELFIVDQGEQEWISRKELSKLVEVGIFEDDVERFSNDWTNKLITL